MSRLEQDREAYEHGKNCDRKMLAMIESSGHASYHRGQIALLVSA